MFILPEMSLMAFFSLFANSAAGTSMVSSTALSSNALAVKFIEQLTSQTFAVAKGGESLHIRPT